MKKYGRFFMILYVLSIFIISSYGGKVPYLLFYMLSVVLVICVVQIIVIARFLKMDCRVEPPSVSKDESVFLEIKIQNNTFLHFPYLKIGVTIPENLMREESEQDYLSVAPRSERVLPVRMTCPYRGAYTLTLDTVEIFDFLHLFSWKKRYNQEHTVMVYPKIATLTALGVSESPEESAQDSPLHNRLDGVTVSDLRLYTQGDSMKKIHWKVSARTGELYAKNFETTTEARNVIVFDLSPVDNIVLEDKLIEVGVSIAYHSLQRHMSVSVVYADNGISTASAESISEFYYLYSLFASVTFTAAHEVAIPLRSYLEGVRTHTNLWVITANRNEHLIEQLSASQAAGNKAVLVHVSPDRGGADLESGGTAVRVYRVGCEDALGDIFL